jgi:hypothetical protein
MKIKITDSNRKDVAEMFESAAQVIKQQSSEATSIAVNFLNTGVVVEVEGTMEDAPGTVVFGRYAVLYPEVQAEGHGALDHFRANAVHCNLKS